MIRLQRLLVSALKGHLAGRNPAVPEAGVLLWNLFMEISASRTYHVSGPNPISHAEIEAYARFNRWPLQPRHIGIIRALDDAWLEHASRRQGDGTASSNHRHTSARPLTAAAFDVVFG